jgi:hypothetical protein
MIQQIERGANVQSATNSAAQQIDKLTGCSS